MRLFVTPHVVIGPIILASALFFTAVLFYGTVIEGTVTELSTVYDSEDGTSYQVKYKYNFQNQDFKATGTTSKTAYANMSVGDKVQLQALKEFPNFGQQFLTGRQPWTLVGFMYMFGALWTFITAFIFSAIFIQPFQEEKVMREGKVCAGRIAQKESSAGEDTTYYLHYEYEPFPGVYQQGKATVTREQYFAATIGDAVNVLCDKDRGKKSVLYKFSEFQLKP